MSNIATSLTILFFREALCSMPRMKYAKSFERTNERTTDSTQVHTLRVRRFYVRTDRQTAIDRHVRKAFARMLPVCVLAPSSVARTNAHMHAYMQHTLQQQKQQQLG